MSSERQQSKADLMEEKYGVITVSATESHDTVITEGRESTPSKRAETGTSAVQSPDWTSEDPGRKHGEQFDAARFEEAGEVDELVTSLIDAFFDPHNITPTEPDAPYDNFKAEKDLHQLLDYNGVDYVIDPFDDPSFGVNHRNHSPGDTRLRFDLRKHTGTQKPSEYDVLMKGTGESALVPRYATRMKRSDDDPGFEWFRVVDLKGFVDAVENGLTRDYRWEGTDKKGNPVVAWMYNYSILRELGLVIGEITP